eukprot:TRINITY_DN27835_c0_g1_i2.p1 TRINITY_DN27835_c0_g1~~TRINITY_DN27835_c0_g1_i2.p1  ORF type:complete len:102 (+),score=19.50 TRINITY_DN27835_c0_g1_i2:717-1022(+)
MVIYHPDNEESMDSIKEIVAAYMEQFSQEGVLYSTEEVSACLSDTECLSHSVVWSTTNLLALFGVVLASIELLLLAGLVVVFLRFKHNQTTINKALLRIIK